MSEVQKTVKSMIAMLTSAVKTWHLASKQGSKAALEMWSYFTSEG